MDNNHTTPPASTRILAWNAERKSPRGPVGRRIPSFLAGYEPDIVVLTEGEVGLLPPDGHIITANPLPGAHVRPDERRVLAWSRQPWTDVEDYACLEAHRHPRSAHSDAGDRGAPIASRESEAPEPTAAMLPGRLVSGTTGTTLGPLRVHAVCIPWHFSRVRGSDVRRRPWQDHVAFLDALELILEDTADDAPTVVAGDFNQRVPRRKGQPRAPFERLTSVLGPPAWSIVTAGATAPRISGREGGAAGRQPLIDHVAVHAGLAATGVEGIPNHARNGQRLSDHTGCVVTVARA